MDDSRKEQATSYFHYQNGIFFGRLNDGSVRMVVMESPTLIPGHAAPVFETVIDPDGWVSIVTSVAKDQDDGIVHDLVNRLHKGEE